MRKITAILAAAVMSLAGAATVAPASALPSGGGQIAPVQSVQHVQYRGGGRRAGGGARRAGGGRAYRGGRRAGGGQRYATGPRYARGGRRAYAGGRRYAGGQRYVNRGRVVRGRPYAGRRYADGRRYRGWRRYPGGRGYYRGRRYYPGYAYYGPGYCYGWGYACGYGPYGVIGAAAGLVIGSAVAAAEAPVVYRGGGAVVYDWDAHVARCRARYRSYNARTDTYTAYSGRIRRCRL